MVTTLKKCNLQILMKTFRSTIMALFLSLINGRWRFLLVTKQVHTTRIAFEILRAWQLYQEYIIEREGEYCSCLYGCNTTLWKAIHPQMIFTKEMQGQAHSQRGFEGVDWKPPLWLLPHPLDVINFWSSALGVGQRCTCAVLIVECIVWKITGNHDLLRPRSEFQLSNHGRYEHGACTSCIE